MKKRQNNSVGASVFQIALCVVLICSSILFASSFRAAPQAAFDGFYPPLPNANQQSGFYPALPNNAPNGTCPSLPISVALPVAFIGPSPSGVVLMPVTTTFIDNTIPPGDPSGSIGFQGDFTFDSSVITFASPFVQRGGLTSDPNWNVSANILGSTTIKTLRISALMNNFVPLSGGPDTLFYLRVQAQTSTFGSSTPLTWAPLCGGNEFVFIDCTLNSYDPRQQNNGLVAIQGPGVNIDGTITYCSNPVSGPVPNVTLTLTGGASGSTSSDSSGNYLFSGLPSGGTYAVTPSKAQLLPGAANINTVDVIATQRHFLNLGTPLSGCQLTAADVNGDGQVNTVDVTAIVRFYLGQSTGIGNTGRYKFIPISRTYTGVLTNQTAQNYDTLVFGDVASPYVH
jgi:dockerin type I repeat protein